MNPSQPHAPAGDDSPASGATSAEQASGQPQADFYILSQADDHGRYLRVCQLVEKACAQNLRVHIQCADAAQAAELDELLWSFRPDSFLPHGLLDTEDAAILPVTLGFSDTPVPPAGDFLINLASQVPPWYRQFARIAEVASQRPHILQATREHFRFFRDQGFNTSTFNLK